MKIFGLNVDPEAIRGIAEHAERDYPDEACGLGLGPADGQAVDKMVPMKNVQDRYHGLDPAQFPRTARDAFRLDELERMKLLDANEGLEERILYHSHCDAGAYFSPEDRANAVHQGIELMPGVIHVVVSVRDGRAADMAAFKWDEAAGAFLEERLPLEAVEGLPDLELRRMEGREASRPIRPVGRGLCTRRLTPSEALELPGLAEGRRIALVDEKQVLDLSFLERGLFSPLTGFMRSADVFSVDVKGRLQGGTPWRAPLRLELPKKTVPPLSGGSIVELISPGGAAVALMVVVSMETTRDRCFLGGPVYVYPSGAGPDAAETRAELVRAQAETVLAVPKKRLTAAKKMELGAYDVLLAAETLGGPPVLPLAECHRGDWMQAVVAQNQGATHVLVADQSMAKQIEDTLAIEPVVVS